MLAGIPEDSLMSIPLIKTLNYLTNVQDSDETEPAFYMNTLGNKILQEIKNRSEKFMVQVVR